MSARCPLCGGPLAGAPSVALRGGGRCHRACADAHAAHAWRRRRGRAWGHLALIAVALIALAVWTGPSPALIGVGLAWGGLHGRLHRRFWHYALRDLRRRR